MTRTSTEASRIDWYADPQKRKISRNHDLLYALNYSRFVGRLVRPTQPLKVVDIGCGYGEFFKCLFYRDHPVEYIGVDPDKTCIEYLANLHLVGCRPILGKAEEAIEAIKTCQPDLVVSILSLALWDAPMDSLRAISRVLPTGSSLIVVDLLKLKTITKISGVSPLVTYKIDQLNRSMDLERVQILKEELSRDLDVEVSWIVDDGKGPKYVEKSRLSGQRPFTTLFQIVATKKS